MWVLCIFCAFSTTVVCVCGYAIQLSLTLPAAVFVDEPTEGRVRRVQEDGVCHGEIGGRQARLPQDLLQVQRLQQDPWVRYYAFQSEANTRVVCIPNKNELFFASK